MLELNYGTPFLTVVFHFFPIMLFYGILFYFYYHEKLFFFKIQKECKNVLRKIYFDAWDLKLEILMWFDTVLCHLHGVTPKNITSP